MAAERDLELLDDLLTNRLSAEDKAYIETRLQQDPDLQREYSIQQNIAEGLKAARKAELKAMLNNVAIPAAGPQIGRWVSAGTIALLLGVGAYLYVKPTDEAKQTDENQPVTIEEKKTEEPIATTPAEPESKPEIENKTSKPDQVKATPRQAQPVPKKKVEVFDPTASGDEDGGENATQPESGGGVAQALESEPQATVIDHEKYKFHYQVNGLEVKLYGPFNNEPYTILDFNQGETRTIFLYYGKKYYRLAETSTITPLSAVNDPVLLQKLREYRGKE
jgi:hypothetical protein